MASSLNRYSQWVFWLKLALIFAALWVTFATRRIVLDNPDSRPEDVIPPNGTMLAFASLVLWTAAIIAGRFMAYIGVP